MSLVLELIARSFASKNSASCSFGIATPRSQFLVDVPRKPGELEATNFTIGLQVQFARPTRAATSLVSPGTPMPLHAMEIHRVASRSFLRASLLSPRIPFVLDFASRLGAGCTLLPPHGVHMPAARRRRPRTCSEESGRKSFATRQAPKQNFFDRILHYMYEGDTALHMAAAAYQTSIVEAVAYSQPLSD